MADENLEVTDTGYTLESAIEFECLFVDCETAITGPTLSRRILKRLTPLGNGATMEEYLVELKLESLRAMCPTCDIEYNLVIPEEEERTINRQYSDEVSSGQLNPKGEENPKSTYLIKVARDIVKSIKKEPI